MNALEGPLKPHHFTEYDVSQAALTLTLHEPSESPSFLKCLLDSEEIQASLL